MEKNPQLTLVDRSKHTPVFYYDGSVAVKLSEGDDDGDILLGDLDGDGKQDLLVEMEKLIEQVTVFGKLGIPLATIPMNAKLNSSVCGDIDGDGMDELLNIEYGKLKVYDLDEEDHEVETWPYGYFPSACHDLNGDGIDEVLACHTKMIAPGLYDPVTRTYKGLGLKPDQKELTRWVKENAAPKGGIFDPESGKFTEFKFPDINWRMNIFTADRGELVCADIDGDKKDEVIAKAAIGTALLAFNRQDKCVYYEEFGAPAFVLGCARSGKRDYIVVQLDKRLIVWP